MLGAAKIKKAGRLNKGTTIKLLQKHAQKQQVRAY
jgi:hypothetical protein